MNRKINNTAVLGQPIKKDNFKKEVSQALLLSTVPGQGQRTWDLQALKEKNFPFTAGGAIALMATAMYGIHMVNLSIVTILANAIYPADKYVRNEPAVNRITI